MRLDEYGDDICAYRGQNGLKCAAGHLMPDSTFRKSMEGKSVDAIGFYRKSPYLKMIMSLQTTHDNSFTPKDMENNLKKFAKEHSLTIPKEQPK